MCNTNPHKLLREKGLKATPQRVLIMETMQKHGHINIDELYEEVCKTLPSISLATVYKNLHNLVEAGVAEILKLDNQKSLFEVAHETHIHHICNECGSVEDITVNKNKIIDFFATEANKSLTSFRAIVYGSCAKCSE